jgi:hypothetical protein
MKIARQELPGRMTKADQVPAGTIEVTSKLDMARLRKNLLDTRDGKIHPDSGEAPRGEEFCG